MYEKVGEIMTLLPANTPSLRYKVRLLAAVNSLTFYAPAREFPENASVGAFLIKNPTHFSMSDTGKITIWEHYFLNGELAGAMIHYPPGVIISAIIIRIDNKDDCED